jgi:hypothetical protein
MYSILTYESNKVKIRHDIRVNKCSATFKAIGEWYVSPMLDHIKICKDFECKKEYQLLKNDIAAFIVELEKPVNLDYRKSLFCIFNYFESTALAVNEGLMDELFIKKYFRGTFFEFYDAYFLFIEIRRKIKNDQEIFSEFTNLVNKWKS